MVQRWSERFSKPLDTLVAEFNASISFDQRLAEEDIAGSIAHAHMLGKQGIIPEPEAQLIVHGLEAIREEIRAGTFRFHLDREDIHINIETALTERIGPIAGKLHTGRSRNDQVALDMRLFVRSAIDGIRQALRAVVQALLERAEEHAQTVLPGYTHMQRAQPIVLAHHLLAYVEMFRRDYGRLGDARHRLNESPLGSGALAGTTFPLDRMYVAHELGFSRITRNSLDAVSDRDFALEFLAALAVLSVHLSRFTEELVLWSTQEFRFVIFDDAYATGSSMMPQKKNPDTAELIRGKTGRIIGHLVSLLVMLKGLPLAYNKDLQEDKEALFDAYDTTIACLRVLEGIIRTLIFQPGRMREATGTGHLTATDLADYLAARGVPFREAHSMVSRAVRYAEEHSCLLEDLSREQIQEIIGFPDENLLEMLDIDQAVARRNVPGGTSPLQVEYALAEVRAWLTHEQA